MRKLLLSLICVALVLAACQSRYIVVREDVLLGSKGCAFVDLGSGRGWLKIVLDKVDRYSGTVVVYHSSLIFDAGTPPYRRFDRVSMDPFSLELPEFGLIVTFTAGSEDASYVEILKGETTLYYCDRRSESRPPKRS